MGLDLLELDFKTKSSMFKMVIYNMYLYYYFNYCMITDNLIGLVKAYL